MRTLNKYAKRIGESFLTRGRKTQYLENGKVRAYDDKWLVFESIKDLKRHLQEEDFINERSHDVDVNNIFEDLPFLGIDGFRVALNRIDEIENSLFEKENKDNFSDLKVAIWSKYKGLPDNSFQNCQTGKIYTNIDDIDTDENLDEDTRDNLTYFLSIAPTIPEHEIWYAYYLYNNIQNLSLTNDGYRIDCNNKVYEVPEESSLYDEIMNNEFGVIFCGRKNEDDSTCCDVSLDTYNNLNGICAISTTIHDASTSLSTIQMYLSAFKDIEKYLSISDLYKDIIDNEFFQNFIINYTSRVKDQEYNVEGFTDTLRQAIDEELEKLASNDFIKGFDQILKSDVVNNWRDSIEDLQSLLVAEDIEEVLIKLITAHNILFNIKNKLYNLFESKKNNKKSLNEDIQFRMTKGREGAFVYAYNNKDYYYPDNYEKVNINNQPWDKDQVKIKPEIWARGEEEMLKKSKERKDYDNSYKNKALNKHEIDRWGDQAKKVIDDTLFAKEKSTKPKDKKLKEAENPTRIIWADTLDEAQAICSEQYYKYFAEGSIQKLLKGGEKATYGFVVDSKDRPLAGIAVLLDGKKGDVCKDESLPYLWELASTTNNPDKLQDGQEICPFAQAGTGTQLAKEFAENVGYRFWFKTASSSANNYWKYIAESGKLGKVLKLYEIGTTIWHTPIYQTVKPTK